MNDEKANVDSYIERLEKPCGVPPVIQREAAQIMRKQAAKLADYADLTSRLQEQCDGYMSNALDAWDRVKILETDAESRQLYVDSLCQKIERLTDEVRGLQGQCENLRTVGIQFMDCSGGVIRRKVIRRDVVPTIEISIPKGTNSVALEGAPVSDGQGDWECPHLRVDDEGRAQDQEDD